MIDADDDDAGCMMMIDGWMDRSNERRNGRTNGRTDGRTEKLRRT